METTIMKLWREYRGLALFLVLMVVFRSALADWNVVPTGSMKPTILEGDRILVDKLAYDLHVPLTHVSLHRFGDPERGDIVVFDSKAADTRLVKRVIGVPGDTVTMRDNKLVINGVAARYSDLVRGADAALETESYPGFSHRIEVARTGGSRLSSFGPVIVPQDHYLVLGDNRDNSADSRVYGFVPRQEIVGHATRTVLSLDYDNHYIPRADRFFRPL
jgi:signal peptidase I